MGRVNLIVRRTGITRKSTNVFLILPPAVTRAASHDPLSNPQYVVSTRRNKNMFFLNK